MENVTNMVFLLLTIIGIFAIPVESCESHVDVVALMEPANLYSTNYPRPYPKLASCSWRVLPSRPGGLVYIEVVDVDLDNSKNNCSDNLSVYDGFQPNGPPLLRVCGQTSLTLVKSSPDNAIYITFTSDAVWEGKGFALRYWIALEGVNPPTCPPGGAQRVIIGATPHRLDLSDIQAGTSDCDFQLETDDNHLMTLRPVPGSVAVDCETDNITVYDGVLPTGAGARLGCSGSGFTSYRSSGRYLYLRTSLPQSLIQFYQLSLMIYREPRLSDECSLTVFPQIDVPFSPLYLWIPYSKSTSGQPCPVSTGLRSVGTSSELLITILGSNSAVKLNCSDNYIQVSSYSDTTMFLHKPKCGSNGFPYYSGNTPNLVIGQPIVDTQQRYLVEVKSQGYACSNTTQVYEVTGEDSASVSLDIPIFSRSITCTFRFMAVESRHLLRVMFKNSNLKTIGGTHCTQNHFRLYDGYNESDTSLGSFCGQDWTQPPIFSSTSGALFVELVISETGTFVHVEMEYSSFEDNRCNGTFTFESAEKDQFITSPAFPNSLARNLQCMYLVQSPAGNSLIVEILDYSFPPDCSDNITVFDGNNTTSPVLMVWCDSPNTTLEISGPAVLMMLSSSSHSTDSRYRIRYVDNIPKFGSPDDPRVPIAISAIVGLANGVGLICFLVFGICYWKNKNMKQEDEKTLEEKLEDDKKDMKETASLETLE